MVFPSHLRWLSLVPDGIESHVGQEQCQTAGETLGPGEVGVGWACEDGAPGMEVCHVLSRLDHKDLHAGQRNVFLFTVKKTKQKTPQTARSQ